MQRFTFGKEVGRTREPPLPATADHRRINLRGENVCAAQGSTADATEATLASLLKVADEILDAAKAAGDSTVWELIDAARLVIRVVEARLYEPPR